MGGCQNYGPFLGTLNIRGRIIIATQKGTIILTTIHMSSGLNLGWGGPIKVYTTNLIQGLYGVPLGPYGISRVLK